MVEKVDINQIHDDFNRESKEIQGSIETITDQSALKHRIIQLQNKIEEVSHLLPRYQQLSYTEQIRALLDTVDKKKAPQRRFKFSKRPSAPKKETQSKTNLEIIEDDKRKPNIEKVNNSIRSITDEPKVLCKDIESSVLVFKNLESITLNRIENSIIYVECKGPCFLFEMKNSKIFVKCQQLRIHNTASSEIFPEIASQNAIIECCSGLVFKDSDIQVNDFDSPGNSSTNYTKSEMTEEDNDLLNKLKQEKLQEILTDLTISPFSCEHKENYI